MWIIFNISLHRSFNPSCSFLTPSPHLPLPYLTSLCASLPLSSLAYLPCFLSLPLYTHNTGDCRQTKAVGRVIRGVSPRILDEGGSEGASGARHVGEYSAITGIRCGGKKGDRVRHTALCHGVHLRVLVVWVYSLLHSRIQENERLISVLTYFLFFPLSLLRVNYLTPPLFSNPGLWIRDYVLSHYAKTVKQDYVIKRHTYIHIHRCTH